MVRAMQRYISKELTHFVGRGLSIDSQYKLLIKILEEECLTHPPHNSYVGWKLIVQPSANISRNEMYSPQMVCFCDIPVEDLSLHARKYSCFGLSFDKDFIVRKGGAPVHYIPIKSSIKVLSDLSLEQKKKNLEAGGMEQLFQHIDRGEYFDKEIRHYYDLFLLFHKLIFESLDMRLNSSFDKSKSTVWDSPLDSEGLPPLDFTGSAPKQNSTFPIRDLAQDAMIWDRYLYELQRFLDFQIFSYVKFFDHTLPDDHEDNYYFEREWRVLGNVEFRIEDVMRVLIPEKYAKRLREDCPQYYGQLTFIE